MPYSPREIEDDVFRQKEVDPQAAPIVRCLTTLLLRELSTFVIRELLGSFWEPFIEVES